MNESFLADYPEILALLVALAGFGAAGLMARWFERAAAIMDRRMRRLAPQGADRLAGVLSRKLLQRVVYFATLVFFLLVAIRLLGVTALTDWLDALIAFLPQLLLGGIIIVGGYLLGILSHSFVANLPMVADDSLLPRLAQAIVVVTAVMTGLEQVSIDVSFISDMIVILLAAGLGGLAIAFGLGSRDLVANLLARRSLDRYRVGEAVRIGDIEGTIIEFTKTGVAVQTDDGIVNVPASRFAESIVTVIKS